MKSHLLNARLQQLPSVKDDRKSYCVPNTIGYQKLLPTIFDSQPTLPPPLQNSMATFEEGDVVISEDGDVFDSAMEFLVEEVWNLGRLRSGAMYGRKFLTQHLHEILDDPHQRMVKALERLSKLMAEGGGPRAAIRSEEIGSGLLEAGLVNILFACLPWPVNFEESKQDVREFKSIYDGFREFVEYLSIAVGREAMGKICGVSLLNGLFSALERAVASSGQDRHIHVWKDELRRLAWDTRGDTRDWSHKPQTSNLLKYLRWDVQGRKDSSCTVEKPWANVDLETLRCQPDMTRPFSKWSRNCANCSAPGATVLCTSCKPELNRSQAVGSVYCDQACREAHSARHALVCQDTKDLSRAALLFQITFVQYLLSVNFGTTFVVSEEDGVVYSITNNIHGTDQIDMGSDYVGVSPDLDLSLSKVKAALHGFHCCDIETSARPLLEYFFRGLCTSIQFLDFVPKNARTPLQVEASGRFRFNMSALHTVALLTTRSGRKFVLDPTATQFGWKEHLVEWNAYSKWRDDLHTSTEVCEPHERPSTPTEDTPRPTEGYELENWLYNCVVEDVLEFAEAEVSKKGGLDAIFQLPQSQFREWRTEWKKGLASEMRKRDKARI